MSKVIILAIKENAEELKRVHKKSSPHLQKRIKMLQYVLKGIHKNEELSFKTGASLRSVIRWKQVYIQDGIEGLLKEGRGGDMKSEIDDKKREKLQAKLSDSKQGFTSYEEARRWIETELGVTMNYGAAYMYLRRNFKTKLKTGRKSHIKKDEQAVSFFKKNYPAT